jgi:hypothetical protein
MRQRQHSKAVTQVFAGFAFHAIGLRHQRLQRTKFLQPFRRGFRPNALHARNIVDAVTHQRQIVHDPFRRHTEFGDHRVAIHDRVGHGVDQRDALVHQLGDVLVTGGDQHVHAGIGRALRQRSDDVIGLDPRFAQQRQAKRAHQCVQRFDLQAQIIRHGGAVGLVFGIDGITEGTARRIEDHGDVRGRVGLHQLLQHVDHALDGTVGWPVLVVSGGRAWKAR